MKSRLVEVRCPACGYATMLKKETYVVASFEAGMKERLISGEYFQFRCPRCQHLSSYAHPLLYYDAQKHFVLMLNEQPQDTSFSSEILCVQVHTAADFSQQLRILDDGYLPSQIFALTKRLQQRYPDAQFRYDGDENDVLWFSCHREQGTSFVGVNKASLRLSRRGDEK